MPKCKKCGTFVPKDDIFCPECKTKVGKESEEKNKENYKRFSKTTDYSKTYSEYDKINNKIFALLCYIPFVCLYPVIVTAKKSTFVRFHAGQGLALFIVELILSALFTLLTVIVLPLPIIGMLLGLPITLFGWVCELVILAATIYGIYQTLTGKAVEMPFIGKLRFFK